MNNAGQRPQLPFRQQVPVGQAAGVFFATAVDRPMRLAKVEKRFCTDVLPHCGQ